MSQSKISSWRRVRDAALVRRHVVRWQRQQDAERCRQRCVAARRPSCSCSRRTRRRGSTSACRTASTGAPAFDRAKLAPAKKLAETRGRARCWRARSRSRPTPPTSRAFALRPSSQPPPRTGTTIKRQRSRRRRRRCCRRRRTTPARTSRCCAGCPRARCRSRPSCSVTFSQPMVAVTSQDDAAATTPVKLTPQPQGHAGAGSARARSCSIPRSGSRRRRRTRSRFPAGTKAATGDALEGRDDVHVRDAAADAGVAAIPYELLAAAARRADVRAVRSEDRSARRCSRRSRSPRTASRTRSRCSIDDGDREATSSSRRWSTRRRRTSRTGAGSRSAATQPFPADASIQRRDRRGHAVGRGAEQDARRRRRSRSDVSAARDRARASAAGAATAARARRSRSSSTTRSTSTSSTTRSSRSRRRSPGVQDRPVRQLHHGAGPDQGAHHVHGHGLGQACSTSSVRRSARTRRGRSRVGDAHPTFYGPSGMVVLDPAAKKPTLDFFTRTTSSSR